MDNKQQRMQELVSTLNRASHAYYVMDDPVISDMQYDKLYDELKDIEAETGIERGVNLSFVTTYGVANINSHSIVNDNILLSDLFENQ